MFIEGTVKRYTIWLEQQILQKCKWKLINGETSNHHIHCLEWPFYSVTKASVKIDNIHLYLFIMLTETHR